MTGLEVGTGTTAAAGGDVVHKNLRLIGTGIAAGYLAGRFPLQTRTLLTKIAQSIESRTIRRGPEPRVGGTPAPGTSATDARSTPPVPPSRTFGHAASNGMTPAADEADAPETKGRNR